MFEYIPYLIFSLMFTSAANLDGPTEIGVNAKQFVYPASVSADKITLQITFVEFDIESQKQMNMSDSELMNYVKTSFMGTSKPAESTKERIILGKESKGQIVKTKIPSPGSMEVHLLTLSTGKKIVVGFKARQALAPDEMEKLISEITGSLKEK